VNVDYSDEDEESWLGKTQQARTAKSSRREPASQCDHDAGHSAMTERKKIEKGGLVSSSDIKPSQNSYVKTFDPVERWQGGRLASVSSLPSSSFFIPELPSGRLLTINMLSTWGDPHYIGLMGIDIFDKSGHIVRLENAENQIWANPADINVLPEYGMA
jgi:hypothetical protein